MRYQFLGLTILGILWNSSALAQTVTSDGTVNTVVTDVTPFVITGGTQQLTTLFHSFSEFSPDTADVLFQLANSQRTVDIVIGRVTGSTPSFINGQLELTGGNTPDLFLINPNGISFGDNASLLLPGSFLASTAESVLFQNNLEFSASQPETAPLLTVNTPVGLQYGANSAPIDVAEATLIVNPRETLSLIGKGITLTNSFLSTPQGRIELGSLADSEVVSITPQNDGFTLGYGATEQFADISLNQISIVDVSGEGAGNIHLQGRAINILDDSYLAADTLGAQDGGTISITASESVNFFDTDPSNSFFTNGIFAQVLASATGQGADVTIDSNLISFANESFIFLNTSGVGNTGDIILMANDLILTDSSNIVVFIQPDATGNGGDIKIDVDQLALRDASQIGSGVFGMGNGSNIMIDAVSIDANGESADGNFTSLITSVVLPGALGNSGDIVVTTDELRFLEGAQLFSGTFGEGNAGNIDVQANSIELIGESSIFGFPSGFLSNSAQAIPDVTLNASEQEQLSGKSGNINIETESLQLLDGGTITSSTSGDGDAATISIQAADVAVVGSFSLLSSETSSSAASGNIQLTVERLSVQAGGQISAETSGAGNAGTINIQSDQINISGASPDGSAVSRINAISSSVGNAGSIGISANDLTVSDQGIISVGSTATGDAGNLDVIADSIRLDNQGSLQASTVSGEQGNITLRAQSLLSLRNSSTITTNATGEASGGNITIVSPIILGLENSDIVANAVQGRGGNIDITTQEILGLEFREQLTPGNDITASSQSGVNGTVEINTIGFEPSAEEIELPTTFVEASNQITQGCVNSINNQFIVTGRGGIPENPTQIVSSANTWVDMRDFSSVIDNIAPDVSNATEAIVSSNSNPLTEATAWQTTADGQVELIVMNSTQSDLRPEVTCSGFS